MNDASDKNSFAHGLDQTLATFGRADILINGAGVNAATPFFDIKIDEFNDIIKSQINSTLFGCQVFGEYMLDQGKGSILIFPLRRQAHHYQRLFPIQSPKLVF